MLLAGILTACASAVAACAWAQPLPGTPLGPGCPPIIEIRESTFDPSPEFYGPFPTACPVAGGFVVLLDVDGPTQRVDPRNWSDVVAFTTGGPPQPGVPTDHFWYISDSVDPTTNIENGISPQALAAIGVTPADIIGNPTTVYMLEGLNTLNPEQNKYVVVNTSGITIEYRIYSDPPEGPTPTKLNSWGRIKILYR
jgi:hypothetical protein